MKKALTDAEIEEPYFSEILGRLTIPANNIVNTPES